jgi:fatty acid desaturase (delta-4 desaturase)
MPPNANLVRRSDRLASKATVSTEDIDNDQALQSVRTLKSLKGTEIAIDGVIYDIADFVHPGGEVVKFFGGNDVTVQYKMIHPYHTNKHLEKMKMVGKVVDYMPE